MDKSGIQQGYDFGSKKEVGVFPVPGMHQNVFYTVLYGKNPGPTVLITAGIHSLEYAEIQALMELSQELPGENLYGNLILLPVVNHFNFENSDFGIGSDREENKNRIFPGCPDDSAADRVAAAIYTGFIQYADFYIDLHGSSSYEDMVPYIYYVSGTSAEYASRELAQYVDVSYAIHDEGNLGRICYAASQNGIPGILIVRGSENSWSDQAVEETKKTIKNLLFHVRMLDGKGIRYNRKKEFNDILYFYAPKEGYWHPRKKAGDFVRKNELLGEIKNSAGELCAAVFSETSGVILYQVRQFSFVKNGLLMACGI